MAVGRIGTLVGSLERVKRLYPLLILFLLLLSACQVKLDQATLVRGDGSGTLSVVIALDDELRELMAASDQDIKAMAESLPVGFDTRDYVEGDLEGIASSVDFADLGQLNDLLAGELGGGQVAENVSVMREGDAFRFRATLGDVSGQLAQLDSAGAFLTDEVFDDVFDITIRVRLPGDLVDHNADEVGANGELLWRIDSAASGELYATSSVATGVSMSLMMVVVAGVAALGLGAALLFSRPQTLASSPIG